MDNPDCPFSIQKIAELGTLFNKKVGEWFGPTTIAQVMQYAKTKNTYYHHVRKICDLYFKDLITVYVADQGTMYMNHVLQRCMENPSTFTPIVLLFPVRLGLDKLNMIYHPQLARIFEAPGTLGIVGGKPRHSLYFVGHQGDEFVYLDPHIVQKACSEPRTYHCNGLKWAKVEDIDPSLCLGFYCNTKSDLDKFVAFVQQNLSTKSYPLISIVQQTTYVASNQVFQQVATTPTTDDDDDDDLVIV